MPTKEPQYFKDFSKRIEQQFDGLHHELTGVKNEIAFLKDRVTSIEGEIFEVKSDVKSIHKKLDSHTEAIGGVMIEITKLSIVQNKHDKEIIRRAKQGDFC